MGGKEKELVAPLGGRFVGAFRPLLAKRGSKMMFLSSCPDICGD